MMASAGAGKTATLLAAVSLIDCSVLVLAFGKRNADELNKALPALSVTARSFNSAGLNVWTSNPRHTRNVFQSKTAMLLAGLLPPVPCAGRLVPHRLAKYRAFAKKAVALAKCDLLGVDGPDNEGAWQTLFARHRAQLCRLLPRGGGDAAELAEGLALASEALKRSRDACFHKIDSTNDHVRDNTPCIDFDDQVYMPLWCLAHLPNHGMSVSQRDFVVVDEAQDMNPARTELMLKLMAPCGRCLVVGDTRQTIYGFSGSTSNGMAKLAVRLDALGGCARLPLSVSWRCPRVAVDAARALLAGRGERDIITARPGAPRGVLVMDATFVTHPPSFFFASDTGGFDGRAVVLARSNSTLVALHGAMRRRGIPCQLFDGTALESALMKLLDKSLRPNPRSPDRQAHPARLEALISARAARTVAKAEAASEAEVAAGEAAASAGARFNGAAGAAKRALKAADAADCAECLRTLIGDLCSERGPEFAQQDAFGPLRERIKLLYGGEGGGGGAAGSSSPRFFYLLVTIHKFKGDQARLVYIAQPDDFLGLSEAARVAAAGETPTTLATQPVAVAAVTAVADARAAPRDVEDDAGLEEEASELNVSYVALTRSMGVVVLLRHQPWGRGEGSAGSWKPFDPAPLLPPTRREEAAAAAAEAAVAAAAAAAEAVAAIGEAPTQPHAWATQPAVQAA